MTMKAVTDETLKLKTWVLKVSIDCQGCKKKVQKILKGVDGVYGTVVDAEHNKVTVTGEVDADTLIKILAKSGKHAELLSQEKLPEKKKKEKSEKQSNPKGKDSETKSENVSEDPKTVSSKEGMEIPEVEDDTGDIVGKQRKKKSGKKMSHLLSGDGGAVGSPVSTLQPFDPTAYNGYPMSTLQPLDPTAYHAYGYEDETSGCLVM